MEDKKIYGLTPAQDVVYLQCRLSLHKNVVNIKLSFSANSAAPLDVLLKKAGGTSIALGFIPVLFATIFPVICFLGSLLI